MAGPATIKDGPARRQPPRAACPQDAAPPAPGRRSAAWGARLRFYVCVGCLLLSAGMMELSARWLGSHFQKQPLPLRRPLAEMDPRRLGPRYELHPLLQPQPLSDDELETLGTREYLSWFLVDRTRPRDDPACAAHVFISYYTGKPDLVPHVPEECQTAAGATQLGLARTVRVPVAGVGAPGDRVPVRMLSFQAPRRRGASLFGEAPARRSFRVLYFFHVNGKYRTTRNEVRLAQLNLFDRHAYYAKVEVRFTDYSFRRNADEQQAVAAVGPLLRKLLPVLLEDHLPDWQAAETGSSGPGAR